MQCILRIGGDNLSRESVVAAMGSLPYREDNKGDANVRIGCLYYDVAEGNDQSILMSAIEAFLRKNDAELRMLSNIESVTLKNLDIALAFHDARASLSAEFGSELIHLAAQFDLSITISIYKTSAREMRH
jgi:hypothetical protein